MPVWTAILSTTLEDHTMDDLTPGDPGKVRAAALERVARGERNLKAAIAAAAVFEASGLIAFFLVMDVHDRLHWLLLIAALLIYGTLALGICALGTYVKLSAERVLKAISLQGLHEEG
jgi:hypothetical protein